MDLSGIKVKIDKDVWKTAVSKALLEKIKRLTKENEELKKQVEELQQSKGE